MRNYKLAFGDSKPEMFLFNSPFWCLASLALDPVVNKLPNKCSRVQEKNIENQTFEEELVEIMPV